MAVSYTPFPAMTENPEDTGGDFPPVHPHQPTRTWIQSHRKLVIMVGMVVATMAIVAAVSNGKIDATRAVTGHMDAITLLEAGDPCANFPRIRLGEPTHNNLAGKGPDDGAEGIVYPATDLTPGQPPRDLILVVNAMNSDATTDPRVNGMKGKYGIVSSKGGTKLDCVFSFFDAKTQAPVVLREIDISFFDLDTHTSGHAAEYVKLLGLDSFAQYVTTKDPLIDTIAESDGVKFLATSVGTADDNPSDPLLLTVKQKQKAVTVKYFDTHKFEVQFGSDGANDQHRWFQFVLRPSLLCAKTQDGGDVDLHESPTTTKTTTTAAITSTAEGEKRNCLFVVPVVNWCFPKFW